MLTAGLPANVNSARICPSPGVSISSARHATGNSPQRLRQAAHAGVPAADLEALALPRRPAGVRRAGRRPREHRPAGAVEVPGQHVEHVDEPARQRPELLGAGPDPPVDRRASRRRPARAPCAGSRRPRSRTPRRRPRARSRRRARCTSSSPSQCSASGPGSARPSSNRTCTIANRRWASVPGRMK